MKKIFNYQTKVYYEDTDAGGVVYYANYLKFLERARTEFLASIGYTNKKLLEKYQILIIVKSCNINFIKPAKLEDIIKIKSEIKSVKKVSFFMKQTIKLKKQILVESEIHLVSVNNNGRPSKLPKNLLDKLIK